MLPVIATCVLIIYEIRLTTVVASSYKDTLETATKTQIICSDIEGHRVPCANSDDDVESISLKERTNKITERQKRNAETLNCSREGDLNMTRAIERGIEFQADFCSWDCYRNSVSGNREIKNNCLSTVPVCALCSCDSTCLTYGDCCGNTSGTTYTQDTEVARADTEPRYICFPIDRQTVIYILASCPVGFSKRNHILQTDNAHNVTGALSEAVTTDLRCNACLSSPKTIHLITSGATKNTYCNQYCLYCNEGRHANSSDFRWHPTESCLEENDSRNVQHVPVNTSASTATHCQTVFKRPDNVTPRQCDSKTYNVMINDIVQTCRRDLLVRTCGLTSDVIVQLERLCLAYLSPVYTDDAVYGNIFCYLCQGKDIIPCWMVIGDDGVSLGILTDLSDDNLQLHDDEHLVITIDDGAFQQTDDGKNQVGYWKDETKLGTGLSIVCAHGRTKANSTTSPEAYCRLEDAQGESDVYKLRVAVYIPVEDGDASTQEDDKADDINGEQAGGADGITSNIHDSQVMAGGYFMNDDSVEISDDVLSYLTIEFQLLCDKLKRNRDVNEDLGYGGIKFNENEEARFVKSEKYLKRRPTEAGNYIPHVLYKSLDVEEANEYKSVTPSLMRGNNSTMGVNVMARGRNIFHSIRTQTVLTLNFLGVPEAYFQFHHIRINSRRLRDGETGGYSEQPARTLTCDSDSGLEIILYVKLPLGKDRDLFESEIWRHFNGLKDVPIGTTVVNVEMVLANSETASFKANNQVYHFDSLNDRCRVSLNSDRLTQLFGETFCSNCRVVPLNLVSACPYVTFNMSDFNVSKGCVLAKDGMLIRRSQYILDDEGINICIGTLRSSLHVHNNDIHTLPQMVRFESILTLVCLTLSLTCLLMTFFTYVTFPTLRSLPGKNNMIMVVCLSAAQLLVILHSVPKKHSMSCIFIGVLLHFSWLFTVLWTGVCSFHMFHVFVIQRGAPAYSRSHTFYLIRYVALCGTSCVFIILSVVLGSLYLSTHRNNIGYGGHICYLNSGIVVGVAFVLPLSVVLLFNFFFFAVTVYTISRIEDVRRHSGRERRNIHIYFRLSSLTGLCWILAVLAEIPGLRPLRLLSIFVNGCQGIVIFLSYVCNPRVTRMWLHMLKSKCTQLDTKLAYSKRHVTLSSSL